MTSSFANDPGLLGALSAFAVLRVGGIAIRLIEMELGEICWIPSMIGGRKWRGPAKGHWENGKGLALWEVDEGDIVVQTCNEGFCHAIGVPGSFLLALEALLGDCKLFDMSVACG
jgi:hypothetical protein